MSLSAEANIEKVEILYKEATNLAENPLEDNLNSNGFFKDK